MEMNLMNYNLFPAVVIKIRTQTITITTQVKTTPTATAATAAALTRITRLVAEIPQRVRSHEMVAISAQYISVSKQQTGTLIQIK